MLNPHWLKIQRIACAEVRRKGINDPNTIEDLLQSVCVTLLAERSRKPSLTIDELVSRTRCRALDVIKSHQRAEQRQAKVIAQQSTISVRHNGKPLI
ncbi:MAG: hypothetical protein JNL58_22670 [Planctomyces sp.]|nr:hypothetical protein [Planctomyces sp.]